MALRDPALSVLRGVIAPNLTPFEDDLSIAEDLYLANAAHLLASGCVALAPFGTTGEALSLGLEERLHLLARMVDHGIDPARLLPGTGLNALPDTASLTRQAVELGCAGAMVLPPFYYKNPSDEGLYAYYARLIEAVGRDDLRLYLYHIPQVAGVGLPVALVRRLREAFPQQVVGIKDSSGDWENSKALMEIEGLVVYPATEAVLLEGLALGSAGCISATANLNGAAIARVMALQEAGETEAAGEAYAAVRRFRQILQAAAPIPAQKRLLALWSGDARWATLRPPLTAMKESEGRALAAVLQRELGVTDRG